MPTTQRLLTDETGQALVTAINNIVAAVKPNATEIQMGASDTTTVAEAINSTNQALSKVANAYKKDTGTLDGLKSDLLAFANTMASQEVRAYQFWASANFSPFEAGFIYSGDVQKLGSNRFNVLFANDNGGAVAVGYNAGTWIVNQFALKSGFGYVEVNIDGTALNESEAGMHYAEVAIPTTGLPSGYKFIGVSFRDVGYADLNCVVLNRNLFITSISRTSVPTPSNDRHVTVQVAWAVI